MKKKDKASVHLQAFLRFSAGAVFSGIFPDGCASAPPDSLLKTLKCFRTDGQCQAVQTEGQIAFLSLADAHFFISFSFLDDRRRKSVSLSLKVKPRSPAAVVFLSFLGCTTSIHLLRMNSLSDRHTVQTFSTHWPVDIKK